MKSEILEKIGIKVKNEDNIIKFLPALSIVNNDSLDSKIKILKFHKIPISKLSQIKIFGLDSSELERRITVSKSNNFFAKIVLNPLLLLETSMFSLKKTKTYEPVKRIKVVPVKEKKSVEFIDYLTTSDEFDNLIEDSEIDLSLIDFQPEEKINNTSVILKHQINSYISEESYDRFEKLSSMVNKIIQTIDFNLGGIISNVDDNIMKLIVDGNYTDFEILYKALTYNCEINHLESAKLLDVIKIILSNQDVYERTV